LRADERRITDCASGDRSLLPAGGISAALAEFAGTRLTARRRCQTIPAFSSARPIRETDCVADDTVLIGPVSTSNSLLAGNLQGIFEDFGLIRQFSSLFSE
jgi:hypothetical protein